MADARRSFFGYVNDLESFMEHVVLPQHEKPAALPVCAFDGRRQSAGMTLQRHPKRFARAVLTAPMIAPSSAPFPSWMGAGIAKFMCAIGKTKEMAFIGQAVRPQKRDVRGFFRHEPRAF